jgi:hypothetical protein
MTNENESERISKEAVITSFMMAYSPSICLDRLRKTTNSEALVADL